MAATSDRPDVIPAATVVPEQNSSSCSRLKYQSEKGNYRETRPPSGLGGDDPTTVAEGDMGTLPKVFDSVRTTLPRQVTFFLGVQTVGHLCDRFKLDVQRQEGSDVFAVGGDLPELKAFHEDALNVLKKTSSAMAYCNMFGKDDVENLTRSETASPCKLLEDSPPSADALKTPLGEHMYSESVQAELQTLPLTPGSYTLLSCPVSSSLASSSNRGHEAWIPSNEIFLETHTQLSQQAVVFLGILQISQICENLQLKLFSHQGLRSFVVVGRYQVLQSLHQQIRQLLFDSSTSDSYACVYGIQTDAGGNGRAECSAPDVNQSQVGTSQSAASQLSITMSGSLEDETVDSQTGEHQVKEDNKSVSGISSSKPTSSDIRKSEQFQLNKLTMDLVEILAKQKLTRIEKECKVIIRRDRSSSTADFISVEGTGGDCNLVRGVERLKQECLDVSRQDMQEAKIKLERTSNVSSVRAINFEEMRVVGRVETEKCTIYGLKEDVEGAEKKIRRLLEQPGLPLSASNNGTFTLQSGQTVVVKKGNIIQEDVDVIVNAANEHLEHSGGVAAAICKAAGETSFQDESRRLVQSKGSIREGGAVCTGAGLLPFKMIVHAVAPRWSWNASEHGHQNDSSPTCML